MSPETLVQAIPSFVESLFDSTTPFSSAEFDQHVMTTYARYPIALERGEGCRVWGHRRTRVSGFCGRDRHLHFGSRSPGDGEGSDAADPNFAPRL